MTEVPWFLKRLPDGRWQDTRLKYGPGTMVKITGGTYEGQIAEIETLIGMVEEEGHWIAQPGYNAKLDDGRYITVRWDLIEHVDSQ